MINWEALITEFSFWIYHNWHFWLALQRHLPLHLIECSWQLFKIAFFKNTLTSSEWKTLFTFIFIPLAPSKTPHFIISDMKRRKRIKRARETNFHHILFSVAITSHNFLIVLPAYQTYMVMKTKENKTKIPLSVCAGWVCDSPKNFTFHCSLNRYARECSWTENNKWLSEERS